MIYRVAADAVVLLHLLFILFALLGGLLALKWRWLVWLHLPALVWGAMVELYHLYCPLTPLENRLRHAAGDAGYSGGFIEHHLIPLIYPSALTPQLQLWLAGVLVAVNLLVYLGLALWLMRRRRV